MAILDATLASTSVGAMVYVDSASTRLTSWRLPGNWLRSLIQRCGLHADTRNLAATSVRA